MQSAEVTVDLVGNDTIIPDALLFCGYGTRHAMMLPWGTVDENRRKETLSSGHIKVLVQQLWASQIKVEHGVCVILIADCHPKMFLAVFG